MNKNGKSNKGQVNKCRKLHIRKTTFLACIKKVPREMGKIDLFLSSFLIRMVSAALKSVTCYERGTFPYLL